MHRGYIKLYRRLLDSEMWLKEPFSRGQAWVDLIGLANYKAGHIRKRGIRVELKRGEMGWGERELGKRWRWSRNKVRRFLFELCSENEQKLIPQTEPQNRNVVSRYLLSNYDLYQDNGTTEQTADDTAEGPQKDRRRYQNKKDKKDKNIEPTKLPDWIDQKDWDDFRAHRIKLRKPMSTRAEELVLKKLDYLREQGCNPRHLLLRAIEMGWQTVYPPKDGD